MGSNGSNSQKLRLARAMADAAAPPEAEDGTPASAVTRKTLFRKSGGGNAPTPTTRPERAITLSCLVCAQETTSSRLMRTALPTKVSHLSPRAARAPPYCPR